MRVVFQALRLRVRVRCVRNSFGRIHSDPCSYAFSVTSSRSLSLFVAGVLDAAANAVALTDTQAQVFVRMHVGSVRVRRRQDGVQRGAKSSTGLHQDGASHTWYARVKVHLEPLFFCYFPIFHVQSVSCMQAACCDKCAFPTCCLTFLLLFPPFVLICCGFNAALLMRRFESQAQPANINLNPPESLLTDL